jgi:hypothetical protein
MRMFAPTQNGLRENINIYQSRSDILQMYTSVNKEGKLGQQEMHYMSGSRQW